MNVESKEFWEKVRDEYDTSTSEFICDTSETFSNVWGEDLIKTSIILILVNMFLEEVGEGKLIEIGNSLFNDFNDDENAMIDKRLNFINWCIKKYS